MEYSTDIPSGCPRMIAEASHWVNRIIITGRKITTIGVLLEVLEKSKNYDFGK